MYERSYVFRFCATKNLNSKKPWKKEKSACFLLEWNCCCGGFRKLTDVGGGGTVVNVQERTSEKRVTLMDLSAVDGDGTISGTLSKT